MQFVKVTVESWVIGGTGRLGACVVDTLLARGDDVSYARPSLTAMSRAPINYLVFAHRYRGAILPDGEMNVNALMPVSEIEKVVWATGDRAIVVVSSIDATEANLNQPISYSMSKAALNAAVRYLAKSQTVRINSVSPATFTGPNPQVSIQEVANVIAFLCSPQASGINGQDLLVTR